MKRWFWGKGVEYAEFRDNVVEVTQWFLLGKRFAWRVRPVNCDQLGAISGPIPPLSEVLH